MQENTAVGVDEQGKIVWVEEGGARDWEEESSSCLEKGGQKRGEEETVVTRDGEEWRVVRAGKRRGEERWWFPGFVGEGFFFFLLFFFGGDFGFYLFSFGIPTNVVFTRDDLG